MIISKIDRMMQVRGIRTQRELADSAGLPTNTVSRFARMGHKGVYGRIDSGTLESLCRALDCQPGDLLEYVSDGEAA